jgi:hypothetical protein
MMICRARLLIVDSDPDILSLIHNGGLFMAAAQRG